MTSEHIPADNPSRPEPVWGAPASTPRRWGIRETAAAVGVAAVIAGLGGAAIYAATDGGSTTIGGGPHPGFAPGGPGGPGSPAGPGGPAGPAPGGMAGPGPHAAGATPLHGEFVVPDANGGYTTMLTQTGTVTAVSAASITVRSDDGYTQTYVVPPSTGSAASFAVDEAVAIHATRTDQTATVTDIFDPTVASRGGPPNRN